MTINKSKLRGLAQPLIAFLAIAGLMLAVHCAGDGDVRQSNAGVKTTQAAATGIAKAAKATTETAAGAATGRIEEKTRAETSDVRSRAAALRQRVRDEARARAAGRADLPRAARPAGQPDDPAGALVVVPAGEVARLGLALEETELTLIEVAEDRDTIAIQLIGWQLFWRELEAAFAAGAAVGQAATEPQR